MAGIWNKIEEGFESAGQAVESLFKHDSESAKPKHSHTDIDEECSSEHPADHALNRYASFAPQSSGHVKWFVDGASYFWAVSTALERAEKSIYILDWWLSPELYLRRPPAQNEQYRLDNMLKACAERGVKIYVIVYKEVPQALSLNSQHTKHALEALHPNVQVFRHPDHAPSGDNVAADIAAGFEGMSLRTFDLAKLSHDAVKTLYGASDDVVLFWAHHEKLCVIDERIAFMGGLDMCFGRWDTNSHPIADAHPGNLDDILFPGQDYNNARIYDFEDVDKWENNKLDRTKSSRMGWSDNSISISGPVVNSLVVHFTDRWNYIYQGKYVTQDPGKYEVLETGITHTPHRENVETPYQFFGGLHRHFGQNAVNRILGRQEHVVRPSAHIQLTRSCSPWSSGHKTEHSIANAYIDAIKNAKHFVYIENQFFITAVTEDQEPVANKIGAAIVERIIRAHQNVEDFHIVVIIPAVPAFAGDLKSDGALGTRAIMEYQYKSINRGGHSIIESLQQAGVEDVHRYINFYNLRNYDRINTTDAMGKAEEASGVSYEAARRDFDNRYERSDDYQPNDDRYAGATQYHRFQRAAEKIDDPTWDTVSACYMENGPDIQSVPWEGSPEDELRAFVSEELYVHSKVLIADDHLVICGSANLNDRSQLGTHDSEIAVVIEDPTPVESTMAGEPFTASRFAASLRRQLFRKHLGLLPPQGPAPPEGALHANWTPIDKDNDNSYPWGDAADALVRDPLSHEFRELWRDTARRNTEIFRRAFHPVPDDTVQTWDQYDEFFEKHFVLPGAKEEDKKKDEDAGKVDYGHVLPSEFPAGVAELKALLAQVRGTLVEMPLNFLIGEKELAKKGLSFNGVTDELYT